MSRRSSVTFLILACVWKVTVSEIAVTSDGCDTKKTCRYFPDGCDLTSSDCRFVSWAMSEAPDSIDIELRSGPKKGPSDYIAFAFGISALMSDADLYYCADDEFGTGSILSRHDRPEQLPFENDMSIVGVGVIDRRIHCKFTRPLSVKKVLTDGSEHNFNLTENEYHILMAQGLTEAGELTFHSWYMGTPEKVNFVANLVEEEPTMKAPVHQPQVAPKTTPESAAPKGKNATMIVSQPEPTTGSSKREPEPTAEHAMPTGTAETTTDSGAGSVAVLSWIVCILFTLTQLITRSL